MKTKPNLLLLLLLLLIESIRAAGVTAPFFPLSIRKLITSVPPPPRMQPFIYTALPSRVIFGSGTVSKARAEIAALGCVSFPSDLLGGLFGTDLLLECPEQSVDFDHPRPSGDGRARRRNDCTRFENIGRCCKGDLTILQGDFAVGIYSNATMHTPMSITKDALSINENLGADCVVSPHRSLD